MKIELPTHKGLIIEDYSIEIVETVDYSISEQFKPIILIKAKNIKIIHECEAVDYVNGNWTDKDVITAVENYLKTLEV